MRVRLEKDNALILHDGEPFARGGEAVIWALADRPSYLAKVYHQPTPDQADKLAAMIANPPDDPTAKQGHSSIAWPTQRLLDDEGRCVGFVMPRVDKARSLFDVYNPKSRLQTWPLFHYGYLLRTARNLAIAVRALHARGYVLGDLNESNVLVNAKALVTVVDTDSFQVRNGPRVFRCIVGKPEYIAPEAQGASFAEINQTPEQDNFALAVLIFQLLMQGTHPFAGRFTGEGEPETLARRILGGYFPYAKKPSGPYEPNPTAPPFVVPPPQVRDLMRRCFEQGHARPSQRPDAGAWQKALAEADGELSECVANSQHHFHQSLDACPWCALAAKQGRDPFPAKGKVQNGAEKSGKNKVASTAVSAVKPRGAKALPDAILLPDRAPRRRRPAAPASFFSTPWPWVIGGAAAALLLLVSVVVGVTVMLLRSSSTQPVAFTAPDKRPETAKARPFLPASGPEEKELKPDDAKPAKATGPVGPGGGEMDDGHVKDGLGGGKFGGTPAPAAVARRTPDVFQPGDSRTAVLHLQLRGLVFNKDFDRVMVLKEVFSSAPGTAGPNFPGGFVPPNPGAMGPPGLGRNLAMGGLGAAAKNLRKRGMTKERTQPAEKMDRDYDTEMVRLDSLPDLAGQTLAEQVIPVRAAEITASFPFKKEVEEFQKQLGLSSPSAVFAEQAGGTKDGFPLAAFRFLGVAVQRRELDAAGQPVGGADDWKTLDVESDYKALFTLAGERTEDDKPALAAVEFPGLVMKKLASFGERRDPPADDYPTIESDLKNLAETVGEIPGAAEVARPGSSQEPGSPFDPDPIIPRGFPSAVGSFPGGPGSPASGAPSLPGFGSGPGGMFRPGTFTPPPGLPSPSGGQPGGGAASSADLYVPDHCLIRLFDCSIEPGKTYEYRIQVRMANPNFGRRDAAAADDVQKTELTPKPPNEWYRLPDKVVVPSERAVYALDQAKLDAATPTKEKDKEPKMPVQSVRSNQTVLQLHRWVEGLPTKDRNDLSVGDWVIAERVVAGRGEIIGPQRTEAAYWRTEQERFLMASDQPSRGKDQKRPATVETPFFPDGAEPILVDFTGGEAAYARKHPGAEEAPPQAAPAVQDRSAVEVLLYTADGRLLAHDSATDSADPERVGRLKSVREWIREVKEMKSGKDEMPSNPFGK